MRVLYRVRPYEKIKGSANALYESWVEKCKESVISGSHRTFKRNVYNIVKDFDNLELRDIKKPKVGLVGEILVKFHPTANNDVVDIVESEGAEAVMPDLIGFFLYCAYDADYKYKMLEGTKKGQLGGKLVIKTIEFYRRHMREALEK